MTQPKVKPTKVEVSAAVQEGGLVSAFGTHRIVSYNQADAFEDSRYYHLGCTLTASTHTEDDDLLHLGKLTFDIVDTTLYADIQEIRDALDSDGYVNGDDLDLWRMLETVYSNSEGDTELQNAILGGKVAVLNTLEIDADYQRLGIGTAMLNTLKEYLDFLDIHSIVLIPAPIGVKPIDVPWKEKRANLISFYTANNFEVLPVDDEFVGLYLF